LLFYSHIKNISKKKVTKSICAGESLLASPIVNKEGAGDLRYQWIAPNGDSTSIELLWINNMTTQQAGKYSITVTDAVYCEDSDALLVIVGTGHSIAFSGYDTLFVEPGYILDAGNTAQSYWWNTGDTTAQIAIDSIGQYLVLATSFENCQSTDSVYILCAGKSFFIPNAFTPNGDGLNDVFGVIPRLDYVNRFHISIYNRWGQLIFDTSDLNQGWDGTFKGKTCQAGVYVYRIVYQDFGMGTQENKVMEGTVVLVR
jgi:gliding motility-associated-like protein